MEYRKDVDALKGIAILAVVFFHLGLLKSGYLGVDMFFVISGLLTIPPICRKQADGTFRYFPFLGRKILRLLPLVVLASALCMAVGYIFMLPDHYENVAEGVIAGNAFSENIFLALSTQDYWDIGNDCKPLMHLWYLGILFEFYLFFPPLLWLGRRIFKSDANGSRTVLVLGLVSLVLYLLPVSGPNSKFFFVQYRFFEIAVGGLVGLGVISRKTGPVSVRIGLVLLLLVVFSGIFTFSLDTIGTQPVPIGEHKTVISDGLLLPKPVLLLLTVTLTAFLLHNRDCPCCAGTVPIVQLGKRSYSIYIWHQVLLALYRTLISSQITFLSVVLVLVGTAVLSELTYRFIEQKVKFSGSQFAAWAGGAVLVCALAGLVYLRAGVVRDVSELGIKVADAHRGMHTEYCDRIYAYDRDFPASDSSDSSDSKSRLNVLVEGVSYGRDFANCILESAYADSVNLAYVFSWDDGVPVERVRQADVIFTFMPKSRVPAAVWDNLKPDARVYGIGTKCFGTNPGEIYSRRYKPCFKSMTAPIDPGYDRVNRAWAAEWGDDYVDMMAVVTVPGGRLRLFTPDGLLISHDCKHLTPAGAKYFAESLAFSQLFKTEP